MRLRSFKLRFADRHVRIVPATDTAGCPFSGPGVDLRGDQADRALARRATLTDQQSLPGAPGAARDLDSKED